MREEEIKKKLRAVAEESGRLKAKLDWPSIDNLSPDEQKAICNIVKTYLGEEHIQDVLTKCYFFRWHRANPVEQLRHENLKRLQNLQAEKKQRRGRPKESKDWPVKRLVYELAVIWEKAKGTLPRQYISRFGEFIEKVAEALKVKNAKGFRATWNGHVKEVLTHDCYARLRKAPVEIGGPVCFPDKLEEASDDNKRKKRIARSAVFMDGVSKAAEEFSQQVELERKLKAIPGTEKFVITVKRK